VVGASWGDKGGPVPGIQPHHIIGQGGYDSFGQSHPAPPVYDSHGKGYAQPKAPTKGYGAPHPKAHDHPHGDNIPVVYYQISRPKPEKEEKGYFKAFETKMKEMKDKFTKAMKGTFGYDYDYDYDYHVPTGYPAPGPPADSYGPPPTDSYGPPPVVHDAYGPPPVEHIYDYDYVGEKDKGFGDKMKGYYDKFVDDMSKGYDNAKQKMKEMFGYDYDYDYAVDYDHHVPHHPQTGYGVPAPPTPPHGYGPPAHPHGEHPVIYQEIPRPKEPKAPKGGFFGKGGSSKAPKRRPIKNSVHPVYHAPPHQPSYPAPHPHPAPVYHAPVHHAPVKAKGGAYHPAPKAVPHSAEYGPPKSHDITHGGHAAPVKAKGGAVHHPAPAPSAGVSSYTSH